MTNPGSERLRILVVDDEAEIRELLGEYFSARGHEVHSVDGAQQALSWLAGQPVDVLLTDVQMPGITGVELLSALYTHGLQIGVVVMTGFPTIETATTAMKMGASDYLLKPFRLREVYQAVTRAAGRGRAERRLERMTARADLYERLLMTAPAERPEGIQALLPGVMRGELGAMSSALWLSDGTALIEPDGALVAVDPADVTQATLVGQIASVPLPDGAGVLSICGSGGLKPAHLARLGDFARLLAAALRH